MNIDILIGVLDIESKKLPELSQDLQTFQRTRYRGLKEGLTLRYLQIFAVVKLALERIPKEAKEEDLARLQAKVIDILIPIKQALAVLNPALLSLLSNGQSS